MLKPSAISAMIILEDVIIICPKKFVSQWLVSCKNLALRAKKERRIRIIVLD